MRKLSLGFTLALLGPLAAACNPPIVNNNNDMGGNCVGRQCDIRTDCPAAMGPTTLTGTVRIPANTVPLFNAKVFIPSGAVPALPPTGASCDRCDQVVPLDAAASAVTDINGNFTLTNVPHGKDIPVVIRVGKWQRVFTITNEIQDCTTTALDPEQTRLPKNQSEGNIPRIALSTGGADALECFLRSPKLGLDASEFTPETGNGRVNLYGGANGTDQYDTGTLFTKAQTTPTVSWYDDLDKLKGYDIVLFSCEGGNFGNHKSVQARFNLEQYINVGGKVFASHLHNIWISGANTDSVNFPQQIQRVATFNSLPDPGDVNDVININNNFTKADALADWLILPAVWNNVQPPVATPPRGTLPVVNAQQLVATTDASLVQTWVRLPASFNSTDQYFSFNTPIGASANNQCGQMVFTDIHVTGAPGGDRSIAGTAGAGGTPFPSGCVTTSLTAQEMALIFLFFDLSNCVQPDIG